MAIRDVFIIMPFGEQTTHTSSGVRTYSTAHFDDVYSVIRAAVVEFDATITVNRMEQAYGNLVAAIIRRLSSADVVVAVLAGRNPNVFYELGVRHSLRRNTIMLVEHRDEYPFDLTAYFSHQYSVAHEADRHALREFIKSRLQQLTLETLPDSPVLEILQQAEFEQMRAVNTWETRRAAITLAGLIREITRMDDVYGDIHKALDHFEKAGGTGTLPRMGIVWDVFDGFTKNRPIPGLPTQAYEDAEIVYGNWRNVELLWNEMVSHPPVNVEYLRSSTGSAARYAAAFLWDVTGALDYVISREVAFGLPWSGSTSRVRQLISTPMRARALAPLLNERGTMVLRKFAEFERTYLGVPADVIAQFAGDGTALLPNLDDVVSTLPTDDDSGSNDTPTSGQRSRKPLAGKKAKTGRRRRA